MAPATQQTVESTLDDPTIVTGPYQPALAVKIRKYCRAHPELVRGEYDTSESDLAGHCFVASEVYHVLSDHWTKPYQMQVGRVSHWFLRNADGDVIDLTSDQFDETPDYEQARGRGFGTHDGPSERSQQVIDAIQ